MTRKRQPVRRMIPPKNPTAVLPPPREAPRLPCAADLERVRFRATEVPGIRRQMIEWTREWGTPNYELMIMVGKQETRPLHMTMPDAARTLANDELDRLTGATLYYADDDLCALTLATVDNMPDFQLTPADLPSPRGLIVFARPVATYVQADSLPRDQWLAQCAALGPGSREEWAMRETLYESPVEIIACSWGPTTLWGYWPSTGGTFFNFYSASRLPDSWRAVLGATIVDGTPLASDNEAAVVFESPGLSTEALSRKWTQESNGTGLWARRVVAMFVIAAQRNLAEREIVPVDRPERRRCERAALPPSDVVVMRLNRRTRAAVAEHPDDGGNPAAGRVYRHRWMVGAHWRRQYYPSTGSHRPKLILPYMKGPADAPLLERVYTL